MSNLGAYQWITCTSKKVGGPVNLLLMTGAVGAMLYKLGESCAKKYKKAFIAHRAIKTRNFGVNENIYSVTSPGTSNEGVEFIISTKFKILETDGGAALVEKIGDKNNPYFLSTEFLHTISNFRE